MFISSTIITTFFPKRMNCSCRPEDARHAKQVEGGKKGNEKKRKTEETKRKRNENKSTEKTDQNMLRKIEKKKHEKTLKSMKTIVWESFFIVCLCAPTGPVGHVLPTLHRSGHLS